MGWVRAPGEGLSAERATRLRMLLFLVVAVVLALAMEPALKLGSPSPVGGRRPTAAVTSITAMHDRAIPPKGMVWIPGGTFRRGFEEESDAQPVREIQIDGFWINHLEGDNAQFAPSFARWYVTVASFARSQPVPGCDDCGVPGSIMFSPLLGAGRLGRPLF